MSLAFNSVGFYQMTKLAIIPFTVLLQTLFYAKQFSTAIKLCLLVLLTARPAPAATRDALDRRRGVPPAAT